MIKHCLELIMGFVFNGLSLIGKENAVKMYVELWKVFSDRKKDWKYWGIHVSIFCIFLQYTVSYFSFMLYISFMLSLSYVIISHYYWITTYSTLFWNTHLQLYSVDIIWLNENTCWSWPYCIFKRVCSLHLVFYCLFYCLYNAELHFSMFYFVVVIEAWTLECSEEGQLCLREEGHLGLCQKRQPLCRKERVRRVCG